MPLEQTGNIGVLAALRRRGPDKPALQAHDAVANAYLSCGCHPDIVARLWEELAAALPTECRCLIYGTPALAHPNGLILASGMGTQYVLRLPADAMADALAAGSKTSMTWPQAGCQDLSDDYGKDWIFGRWLAQEAAWCRAVYELCQGRQD